MDTARAAAFLDECRQICDSAVAAQRRNYNTYYSDADWISADREMQARLLSLRALARQIHPELEAEIEREYDTMHTAWERCSHACTRALGVIKYADEVAAILGPTGPQISATGLHPWVWNTAATLWDSGHRRQAIASAAERIDLETRTKVQRLDLQSGVSTYSEAWSDKPASIGFRLRPTGFASGTPDYDSALEGTRLFAMGCARRVRNLATHHPAEPDEQYALEQLAALSVLARWTDDATISPT